MGQQLRSVVSNEQIRMDVGGLSSGAYILQVQDRNKPERIQAVKFLKHLACRAKWLDFSYIYGMNVQPMKQVAAVFFLLLTLSIQSLSADPPRWQKVDIGASGCKAYFPGAPPEATFMLTPDSSKMYSMSLETDHWDGLYFNIITVVLKEGQFTGNEESMLISYMDFLKQQFGITEAVGYGKGHMLQTHPTSKGVIDYWKNSDGYHFTITGWCAEDILSVMYVVAEKDFADYNICNVFFRGFRFPGD